MSSGIPSRSILSTTLAPTGGQLVAKTNAPCSLTSRLRPSPCRGSPFPLVHQNVTAVCSRNRSVFLAGRTRFNVHPRHFLELHISRVSAYGQEKESHQAITSDVLRRRPPALGTKVPCALSNTEAPTWAMLGTLAKNGCADHWDSCMDAGSRLGRGRKFAFNVRK
jgi:hypothetical protein